MPFYCSRLCIFSRNFELDGQIRALMSVLPMYAATRHKDAFRGGTLATLPGYTPSMPSSSESVTTKTGIITETSRSMTNLILNSRGSRLEAGGRDAHNAVEPARAR